MRLAEQKFSFHWCFSTQIIFFTMTLCSFAKISKNTFSFLGSANYRRSGFTGLQLAIDASFIENTRNDQPLPVTITFQEFPFPPYTVDLGLNILYETVFPIITLFSFMCLLVTVIKRVVEEKASGSKVILFGGKCVIEK